ncbi:DNA primase [Streptomyces phage Treat]|uniref:DNA primase n=2 Tax=Immanueltrevirus immanuel3 TaxID=2846399 RepID=A0A2H5BMF8_9CAUD|nr:DNA primase [Streptomyces phage Percastrophe]AUG87519.1 DNA primase [Streptomyces phage Romero]UJQ86922.1 DNA primase [Streptomyces phage Treat]
MKRTRTEEKEWPTFPVGPILESFGGEPVMEDRGWYAYKCPFHGDRSASASVNTILNVFVCHTCDMKGNAVQLIMKEGNKSYVDALRRAEEVAGQSAGDVRQSPDGGRRVSGGSRNRSGSRALRRTWRSS